MGQRHHKRPPSRFARSSVWMGVGVVGGVLALLAVVIFAIGGGDDRPATGALQVSMVEMAFVPDPLRASPGQEVRVTNDGAVRHSLLLVGLGKGVELGPGEEMSFTLPEGVTGTYEVLCDIPGHREAGMVGTMEIREGYIGAETP